jgi:predicted GIY-YIG superfamily endonuclease
MTKCFYVCLLASGPCGYLYVGVTNDIVRRVAEHKSGLIPGYTAELGIDRLVWYETHQYIDQAILREKRIKRWLRGWSSRWSRRTIRVGWTFTAECGRELSPVRRCRPGLGKLWRLPVPALRFAAAGMTNAHLQAM